MLITSKSSVKHILLFTLFTSLFACGGGGGGGSDPVTGNDALTLSTDQLNFTADVAAAKPASKNITGTITGIDVNVRVDIIISGTAITDAVYIPAGTNSGQLTVKPTLPATLGVGTHKATITVYVCPDQGVTCVGNNSQITGSPKTVNVTYIVTGAVASTALNINGKVYDAELPGAEVTFYYSDNANQPIASTITDNNGNYSVNFTVAVADRNKSIIAIARRGSIVLRSVIGNAGTVADASAAAGGTLSSFNYPAAIVSNVTTAIVAVVRFETGAVPSTQAEIDTAIALIKANPLLVQKVIDIAAIIKAVVDYGVSTTIGTITATETNTLAMILANGQARNVKFTLDLAAKQAGLPDAATLVAKVTQDPVTAAQIPTNITGLAATIVNGNSFVVLDSITSGTILIFDGAGKYTSYSNDVMDTPSVGTYSVSGSLITLVEMKSGVVISTIKATILSGNINSFQVSVTIDSVNAGVRNLRRIIPVSTAANSVNNIQTTSLQTKTFVDVAISQSAVIPTLCDGNMLSGGALVTATAAVTNIGCKEHVSGMLKLTSPNLAVVNTVYIGFLADSWDGTTISQAINAVVFNLTEATFNRAYQPLDVDPLTGGPANNRIVLRVHHNKKVTMRIATTGTGSAMDPVIGDYYRNNNKNTNAFSQNIYVAQTVNAFGAIKLNYSTLLDGTRLRYSVKLGKQSGTRLNAVFRTNENTNAIPASLNNPLSAVNSRSLYKLSALTESDILAGSSAAQFRFSNLVDSTKFSTVNFSNVGNARLGKITKADGTVIQTTWAIATVPSAVPNSTAIYLATLTVTETATGNKRYYYVDKTFGTNSFVLGSFRVDAAGTYTKVRGFIATRR
jgi:hypothetical protein